MPLKQLKILHRYEQDKEKSASQALQTAEFEYQQNVERLKSVSDYRLEYMKRLNERSLIGIDSATFSHFHAFIAKLDNAAEQVDIALMQSKAMVEKKRQQWFAQRQKIQAVELLLDKKKQALEITANKQEQKMFDEIATQQFVRRKMLA
jgi:flagellar FliJ protein